MNKINGETVILLSGSYFSKKYMAYQLLELCPDFRVITIHDIARAMEQNLSEVNNLTRQDVVEKIIAQQQRKKIPSIIFDKETLKNNGIGVKNVIHVNINNDEAGCTINIPEFNNMEIKSNILAALETENDVYDKAVNKITKVLSALADAQDVKSI